MCLNNIRNIEGEILTEDLVVYKYIMLVDREKQIYITSYTKSPIEFNKIIESNIVIDDLLNVIEIGLHSLKFEDHAIEYGRYYDEAVVKCIIPKGSKVFEGTFNNMPAYVSNKIIYKELLDVDYIIHKKSVI